MLNGVKHLANGCRKRLPLHRAQILRLWLRMTKYPHHVRAINKRSAKIAVMERLAEKEDLGLVIRDCGLANYREVLALQHQLQEQRRRGQIGDTVLIVEHPPVITLGARTSANRLLVEPDELARRGIDLVEIRRGGGATAHNPGQLVFYPILHLQELRLDINQYVRTLEAIGIELLAGLGVRSERRKGFPGLWVGERKIASIGVRVSRFVTCHGMAINIQNDLSIFQLMVPCGLDGVQMTSVQKETGKTHDTKQIKSQLSGLLVRYVGRASSQDSSVKASGDARPTRREP
jgi:lipoyl(octanoyl) transferase